MEKTCFKCGLAKPCSEFYRHPEMADGLLGKCKSCTRADVNANRQKHLEHYRQYDRERGSQPHRIRERCEYARGKGKEICAHSKRIWILRNPHKRTAENKFHNRARYDPSLVKKPCEICGEPRAQAHHEDYDQPLAIRWLCAKHHAARHKEMRRLGIIP